MGPDAAAHHRDPGVLLAKAKTTNFVRHLTDKWSI